MLKKVLIGVGIFLLVVASVVATYLITNNARQKDIAQLSSQIANLEAEKAAIGPIVTCYTVRTQVKPGQQLTEDLLVEQSIPQSFTNDDFCALSDLLSNPIFMERDQITGEWKEDTQHTATGYYAKTFIEPGTPITKSLVMAEPLSDSLREMDITANRWPIGLTVGDYVDLRITYPLGEDFIVLSHKRVMDITEETLKVYMTEEEQQLYQAALVDYYVGSSNGTDVYLTKYVEPGLQHDAIPFYSVPVNIATVCATDPNIVNAAQVQVQQNLLNLQQASANAITDDDNRGSLIRSGRDRLNSAVNQAYRVWDDEYQQQQEELRQQQQNQQQGGSLITGGVE